MLELFQVTGETKTPVNNGKAKVDSTLGIKYPTLRDHPLHTGSVWLEGKRADDGAQGLWRIHDNLYDLTNFINFHPGGKDWLKITKGTDITEAFESHHLSEGPKTILPGFFVRKATSPRNSPFTFKEDGFYNVLKRRVRDKLRNVPKKSMRWSKIYTDALFVSYLGLFLLATHFRSFSLAVFSGIFLSMAAIAAHNFFHQKDNFRMYYFDFTFMSSRDWRISHAMSHHMHTNTINDLEISTLEPWLQYLPSKKHVFFRYGSWFYSPMVYSALFIGQYIRKIAELFLYGFSDFPWTIFLPFTVPVAAMFLTEATLSTCVLLFICAIISGSIHFGFIGLNAAHHHPNIFHDGDTPRPKHELDWGVHQMDAVIDRTEFTGSLFMVITTFGDHALHHLFPALDHSLLEYLYPVFLETCKEFEVEFRITSEIELIKGQFRQLSKDKPNPSPPKPLKNVES